MSFLGYMRLSQHGSLMTRDDVLSNREIAYQFFGTRNVEFEEPRSMFLWATLFYCLHVVAVYAPDQKEKRDEP